MDTAHATAATSRDRDIDERRRLAAVHRYRSLDVRDGALDRITALAARVFDAPIAAVAFVDSDHVRVTAASGLPAGVTEVRRGPSLSAAAILQDTPYLVRDALTDPRAAGNPLVHGHPGIRFFAAAPLITADGHRLGALNVVDTRPRDATDEQLTTLTDLAALVMDQLEVRLGAFRTVAAERELRSRAESLARTLQRTLLPPALPTVPGLHAAAAYHTASPDQVGGDFYDLFPLDDGRWAFFLGDVCGKGADAAALTSLTRYTLRAAAIYDPDPRTALANLDAVLKGEYQGGESRFCTVVFGVLQPEPGGGFTVTLASGGHPPAVVVRADGTVETAPTPGGQLIGILPAPRFTTTRTRLTPGDTLLLYTDGLTEARTPPHSLLGEDGLVAHLAATAPQGADDVLATIRTLLEDLGRGVTDDTALLALSVPTRPTTVPVQENR